MSKKKTNAMAADAAVDSADLAQKEDDPSVSKFCSVKRIRLPDPPPNVFGPRAHALMKNRKIWVNGTVIHYCFFTSPSSWSTSNANMEVVRRAFRAWKDLGIGLDFKEVARPEDAEVRIGFIAGDGHWSYVGKIILAIDRPDERTMNIDKLNISFNTALHEIGHTIGLEHEHQSPKAGIVWNDNAVYEALKKPPNRWSKDEVDRQILNKLDQTEVVGSNWDPDSIMHYPFEAGLIEEPSRYRSGLQPSPGLSDLDKKTVLKLYPSLNGSGGGDGSGSGSGGIGGFLTDLFPFRSKVIDVDDGDQADFRFVPENTRKYKFSTFGKADCVMVLFEVIDGEPRYVAGDDDGGTEGNAQIEKKLFAGREYIVRVRLYYQGKKGDFGVMAW